MEQRLNGKRKRLDDLPPSDDREFWIGDVRKTEMLVKGCDHYFELAEHATAECVKCRWGFILDSKDILKSGHLYREGKKIL